ncbi:UNVERIFIED_CONTAM: hypothetical protein PYX00_011884 [Menopon gallinae]|uniref:Nucleolar protein 56 n=1 Tax=Menopon gallinae TaxID=328185 RepID=A0AAW2H8Y8_9NEOP
MEFLLFEHISGYALFELREYEDIVASRTSHLYADASRLSQILRLVSFFKFDTQELAFEHLDLIAQNTVHEDLKNFLLLNQVEVVHCDRSIQQALCSMGFRTKLSDFIQRAVRMNQNKLLNIGDAEQRRLVLSASHNFSRRKIEYNVKREDNLIIQSILMAEQLEKDIDSYSKKLSNAYDFYFPELKDVFGNLGEFVNVVEILGDIRHDLAPKLQRIEERYGREKSMEVASCIETTIGNPVDADDVKNMRQVVGIIGEKMQILEGLGAYLEKKLATVAPNLAALVGCTMAAKLIAHAGGLLNLAKCPSSTVQVLGAESALFRALKTKSATPKHGILFKSRALLKTDAANKGRIARFLASKISLASRIDYFGEERTDAYGRELKLLVDKKIKSLITNGKVERTDMVLERVAEKIARFPFSIEGVEKECPISTTIERKENIVSLSLPFDLNLSVRDATLKLKKSHGKSFIYVFSFSGLSAAKAFVENPAVCVGEERETDCGALEEEMNRFMAEYESCERKVVKKVKVYDEDGFYEYI